MISDFQYAGPDSDSPPELPRKGVFIHRKSLPEILDMIVTWAALESMAAHIATREASDAELKARRKFAMRNSISVSTAELSEYSDANIKFHQMILELSGSELLRSTADGLLTHMHAVRRRAMGEGDRASRSVADHIEIIEALEARDAELASRRVREGKAERLKITADRAELPRADDTG